MSALHTPATAKFTEIAPGIGFGRPLPAGWRSMADSEVLVLVGVTGAGKSTAISALEQRRIRFSLLPDRRVVTDTAIIPLYAEGPVTDRVQRFAITQRFTQDCAGGMAAVLAGLAADASTRGLPLVFDGLRGEAEVAHAAAVLPRARFLVLTAPDVVRLMRLVKRGDAFDRAAPATAANGGGFDLPDAEGILSADDVARLRAEVAAGTLQAADVLAKFKIIAAERRNYDPDRAVDTLMAIAPERTAVVATTVSGPADVGSVLARLLTDRRHGLAA